MKVQDLVLIVKGEFKDHRGIIVRVELGEEILYIVNIGTQEVSFSEDYLLLLPYPFNSRLYSPSYKKYDNWGNITPRC